MIRHHQLSLESGVIRSDGKTQASSDVETASALHGSVANAIEVDLVRCIVNRKRPALFRGRHFEDAIILLCVRWNLRYSLTYRDPEEIMAERNLAVDHVTIWRWVQRYAPVLNQRIRREMRHPNRSWRVDETYVKVAGKWAYLYRAVDSAGATIEFMLSPKRDLTAARLFLRLALSGGAPSPRVINVDGHPAYASAITELKQSGELGRRCSCRTAPYLNNINRAGPSFYQEADHGESRLPFGGRGMANN
jgi:transposase, IS6 family